MYKIGQFSKIHLFSCIYLIKECEAFLVFITGSWEQLKGCPTSWGVDPQNGQMSKQYRACGF